jgi:hypothetical protein
MAAQIPGDRGDWLTRLACRKVKINAKTDLLILLF